MRAWRDRCRVRAAHRLCGQAIPEGLGAARLHPGGADRHGDRPGRAERSRQDHAAAPWPGGCSGPTVGKVAPSAVARRHRAGGGDQAPGRRSVGQDKPLFPTFTVAEMLRFGSGDQPSASTTASARDLRLDRATASPSAGGVRDTVRRPARPGRARPRPGQARRPAAARRAAGRPGPAGPARVPPGPHGRGRRRRA